MNGTVLVTGGAGYIGSHACKALRDRGYQPVVLDDLRNGHRQAVKWGPLETVDLLDGDALERVFARHQPVSVMHFAAYAYVGESMRAPAAYYENNLGGTLNLLQVMHKHAVRSIVFSSTCAIYGAPAEIPISEQTQPNPINPYGRSKWMIEQILSDYARAYDLRCCCLRYFNAAGADPGLETGEVHEPETHLIPNILKAALGKIPALQVFGDDYPTPDGTCVRDFIHVTDLAQAHCLALEYLQDNPGVHAFNLGSERGFSIREVLEQAEAVAGRSVPYKVAPRRLGDPPVLVADSSSAQSILGWRRHHSSLGEILRTALDWEMSKRFDGEQRSRPAGQV